MTAGIGRQFMLETQYRYMEPSAQSQGLPQPPLELPYDVTQRPVDLPTPDALALDPLDLRDLITRRATLRNYAPAAIGLEELSLLLWCTQGVKAQRDAYATLRTVPSAGARHAFETLLLVNRVDGLEPGVYRYLASAHKLLRLPLEGDMNAALTKACLNQEQIARSAVTFFWIAVAERMTWRYAERGYRYLLLDAGHVCQNLYLVAEALGCGACAIAAFDDEALNAALELDGATQFAVYAASLGKRG
jgi:SagB-type dehydrogenase family enzyme